MAVFRVQARDESASLIVRARCISCARQIAADRSPPHEIRMWRDPDLSSVTLIRDPESVGIFTDGAFGIVRRSSGAQ